MRTRAQILGPQNFAVNLPPDFLLNFFCLLCFPPRRLKPGRASQNGSASTGKLKYSSVRVEIGQCALGGG